MKLHVVTDSCACFVNWQVADFPVTVVPNKIKIGNTTYLEGVDLSAEDALRMMAAQDEPVSIIAPTTAEYVDVYSRIARNYDAIISIHVSRELYPSWQNARNAVQQAAGNAEIAIIDSRTICAAQGMLVRFALKTYEQTQDFEDVIRAIRGAIERLYSVYYVETLDSLLRNKIMSASHSILGSMLGIKPFLTVEEGHITLIEKVRTRGQAVDQLVDFILEFAEVDDIALLQPKSQYSEHSRLVHDRLAVEYPKQHVPITVYNPSLAALLGTDAIGVVVLESELDTFEDEY